MKQFFASSLSGPSKNEQINQPHDPLSPRNKKMAIPMASQDLSGNVHERSLPWMGGITKCSVSGEHFLKSSSSLSGSPFLFSSFLHPEWFGLRLSVCSPHYFCEDHLPTKQAEPWPLCTHQECSSIHTAWAPSLQKMRQHRTPPHFKSAALTPASCPNASRAHYKFLLLQFCSQVACS